MKFLTSLQVRIGIAAMCLAVQCHASDFVVTNTADSGPGSLRDTLAQAGNGDTIAFDVTGVITNKSAELVISSDVSIIGPGPDVLAVVGNTNNSPRIFNVSSGTTVAVSGLTLRDSASPVANGGAVSNAGNLSITNCVFIHCRAGAGGSAADPAPGGVPGGPGYFGGAIYNSGTLTLVNCNFYTNSAGTGGFGLGGPGGTGGDSGNGGAIYSTGTLLAMGCNFLTNSAPVGGAGGGGFIMPGPIGSPNGSPGGNGGNGGAIYATGPATFINCAFGFNSAGLGGAAGAGLAGTNVVPPGGKGGAGGKGGNGAAIFSLGQLTLTCCTLADNNAGRGGAGGAGGAGYFQPGGIGGNGAVGGAGTLYCTGSVQITSCTFFGNSAGIGGNGGVGGAGGTGAPGGNGGNGANGADGGAIFGNSSNALITLQNTLVTQNMAGGRGLGGAGGSGGVNGITGTNGLISSVSDLSGSFVSLGHNYVLHSAGNTGLTNGIMGDIVGGGPPTYAGFFGRFGGTVWTVAIDNPISSLVDAGDDSVTASPLNVTTDARGLPRISGAHTDIGAYELQFPTQPLVINGSVSNGNYVVTFTNVPGIFQPHVYKAFTPADAWGFAASMSEIAPGVYQWVDTSLSSYPEQLYEVQWP